MSLYIVWFPVLFGYSVSCLAADDYRNACPAPKDAKLKVGHGDRVLFTGNIDFQGDKDVVHFVVKTPLTLTLQRDRAGSVPLSFNVRKLDCSIISNVTKITLSPGEYFIQVSAQSPVAMGWYATNLIGGDPQPLQPVTIRQLANRAGIDVSAMDRTRIAGYTDIFTLPKTKVECISTETISIFGQVVGSYCTGYAWYKMVMNCNWYLVAPVSSSISVADRVGSLVTELIRKVVKKAEDEVARAVTRTLAESALAAVVAAFATKGTGAVSAFTTTFAIQIKPNMSTAAQNLTEALPSMGTELISAAFPEISGGNLESRCDWSDWVRW